MAPKPTRTQAPSLMLRPYQERAVRALSVRLRTHRRVVMVAPTGSGKTVMGAALIQRAKGARVLWLAHRIELLRQARGALLSAGLLERHVGILSGPDKINEGARVLVASVDTLRSRTLPTFDLIVVDEAHRVEAASYQKILAALPGVRVAGLTATPWRLDGRGLGGTFADLLIAAQTERLIAEGWLASPITYAPARDKARGLVEGVRSKEGDYAIGALEGSLMRPAVLADAVAACAKHAPRERTIVFAATRQHGKALAARFMEAGRRVAYLDGTTPDGERGSMLDRFGSGALEMLVNVDVLTEGFDCPAAKCVVVTRPTKSMTRWRQYTGRAARPFKSKRAIILDCAGNSYVHGLPQIDPEWTLEDRDEAGSGDAPAKLCPFCEAVIAASSLVCIECGAEQPRDRREVEAAEAELARVKASEAETERVRGSLAKVAAENGYDDAWVKRALALIIEAA